MGQCCSKKGYCDTNNSENYSSSLRCQSNNCKCIKMRCGE